MANPKLREPLPEVTTVWQCACELLEIAYRIQTGQFDEWRRRDGARILLDKMGAQFKKFREDHLCPDDDYFEAIALERFISIHTRNRDEHWPREKLTQEIARLLHGDPEIIGLTSHDPSSAPKELLDLIPTQNKDTPQGVVENAIHTWSKYRGVRGETTLKMLRQKKKRGDLDKTDIKEALRWAKEENQKFQDEVTRQLFGWDRTILFQEAAKYTIEKVVEIENERSVMTNITDKSQFVKLCAVFSEDALNRLTEALTQERIPFSAVRENSANHSTHANVHVIHIQPSFGVVEVRIPPETHSKASQIVSKLASAGDSRWLGVESGV